MTREDITYIYNKYSRRLYNISFRILSSQFEAEEIMQDCFIKYYNRPIHFLSEDKLFAWLKRVCINASIDLLRKKKTSLDFVNDYSQTESIVDYQPSDTAQEIITADIINEIQKLPDGHRLILDLVLIEGLSYKQISELLGIKEVTLRSQFSRSKSELVRVLNNRKE